MDMKQTKRFVVRHKRLYDNKYKEYLKVEILDSSKAQDIVDFLNAIVEAVIKDQKLPIQLETTYRLTYRPWDYYKKTGKRLNKLPKVLKNQRKQLDDG